MAALGTPFWVLDQFCHHASAVATVSAVLWALRRFNHCPKLGILERQVLHLAWADLGYVILREAADTYEISLLWFGHPIDVGTRYCVWTHFLYSIPGMTSCILQMEIAIGFAAAIFRNLALLTFLRRYLWCSWLLGFLVALGDTLQSKMEWHGSAPGDGYCGGVTPWVTISLYVITLAVGASCYVPCVWHSRRLGFSVQKRIWDRAAWFPVVFLVTCTPVSLALTGIWGSRLVWSIVPPIYNLNGFFNVMVYAWTNRHLRRNGGVKGAAAHPRVAAEHQLEAGLSFPVAFAETVEVVGTPSEESEDGLDYASELVIQRRPTRFDEESTVHRPSALNRSGESRRSSNSSTRSSQSRRLGQHGGAASFDSSGIERTTVTLRNVPTYFSRTMVLDFLNQHGFSHSYDFVFAPMDFTHATGTGNVFVNMVTHDEAMRAFKVFDGFSDWKVPLSSKALEVGWGHPLQGLEDHVERYRNASVMHKDVPDAFKPALFKDGVRIDFPAPTGKVRPPAMLTNRSGGEGKTAPILGGSLESLEMESSHG